MNQKKKIKILGKRHVFSQSKNRDYYFVSWAEPSDDIPNEGYMGYIGLTDVDTYNSIKINDVITAVTIHNGNYHSIIPV